MNPAAHIHAYDRDVLEGVLTQVLLCRQGMPKQPDSVGAAVVGTAVGLVVGVLVGVFVGRNVGYAVGACVVGLDVGATVSTHVWPVWAPWQPLVQRKPVAQAHAQPCAGWFCINIRPLHIVTAYFAPDLEKHAVL